MAGGEISLNSMQKTLWVIANWKSNKTIKEALEWVSEVGGKIERRANLKVVVCPDFVALEEVKKAIQVGNFPLMVGAQDLSPFNEGPHTGEEAASDLKGLAELVILGHSERRQEFSETDEMVKRKADLALGSGIIPLVGVQSEDTPVPEGVKLIAFEPIFAIGSGYPDTPGDAEAMAQFFKQKYSQLEVLYGGSVTSDNSKAFVSEENISGLLIGGASLESDEFIKIVESCYVI